MKWNRLQKLTEAMLSGDNYLNEDEDSKIAVLEYALEMVALKADAKTLIVVTEDTVDFEVVRIVDECTYIRRPKLPMSLDDEIDIDQGLTYAVARFMASTVSSEKYQYHSSLALEIIKSYTESISMLVEQSSGEY
jgi:hypothetical protein